MNKNQKTILVVDDASENIDVLTEILSPEYRIKAATNGERALKISAFENTPDLILLDIMMPDMDGYEVCRILKSDPRTKNLPVIFVTAKGEVTDEAQGFELGAVDYITKPVNPALVRARVQTQIALYDQNRTLEEKVNQRTAELIQTRQEIIIRLGRAAEFKDNETGMHVIRMSHYSRIIAKAINLDEKEVDLIFNAAPMHDIGKIGVPDKVLLKPGKLDAGEWEIIKKHPEFGASIIGEHESELLKIAHLAALTHHEKWNGKGYPHGLIGDEIPLVGRVVAIADVFDALTTDRPYKDAWPIEKAVNLIKEESGQHFDPELSDAFLASLDEILVFKKKYAETAV
ncbi:MAG: HD domain-containing phosphohydrolase [Leptospirales bacterium]